MGPRRRVVLSLAALTLVALGLVHSASDVQGSPSLDFSKHTVIKPKIYHGREKRQISSTREEDGHHTHHLTLTYEIDGRDYILDLRLNRELIPANHFIRYQHQGEDVVHNPTTKDVDLCQYVGVIRGIKDSWAAISTCHGLGGVIFDGTKMHYIQAGEENDIEAPHFLYNHDDLIANHKCGYDGDHGSKNESHTHDTQDHSFIKHINESNRTFRYKRAAEIKTPVRGPYNSNKLSRYVELVVVVDNKEYKELNKDIRKVHHHCKDIANIVNSLYAPLNIFIALVGVVVWTDFDEITLSKNGDTTLTNFLHYRRERLVKLHPNDNAQLLTREEFEGGVVGKALKGPICTHEFSGGVAMDHSNVVGLVATTIAHEMGHNFGMEHDSEGCICPEERCIMSPSSNSLMPTHWSSCSLEYLALAFEHGMDYCLKNKPEKLFGSPVCGNGFVEDGEECDCGLAHNCKDNFCCNPMTCKLHPNATCATGECCDLQTCRPSIAGTVCRSAERECDLPEYCTGESEYCPNDIFKMDSEVCDGGKSFCYQGSCRTKSDQCRLLWGPSGDTSDDKCYEMNKKGSRHGNCGYDRLNQKFTNCTDDDIFCGMLHCRHLNERLEFGMESVSILSHSFINSKGSIIPCRTAIVDLGLNQIDPGLVPDGAKCGDGKMCVNQKCMAVASFRQGVQAIPDSNVICPSDCSGHGICNSLGHCHCFDGYGPPYCEFSGPGGSIDSGPATDPNGNRAWYMLLCISLSGIFTTVLLLAFLTYYSRHNAITCWTKSKDTSTKSPTKSGRQHRFRGGNCLGLYSPSNSLPTTVSPTTPRMSPDDMNSSLLPTQNASEITPGVTFFGHFKGFSLTPIQKANESSGVQNQNFGIENEQGTGFVSSFSPNSHTDAPTIPVNNTSIVKNALNKFNNQNTNPTAQINANKSGNFAHATVHSPTQTQKFPQRSAPPIPSVPTVVVKLPNIHRSNSQVPNANKQNTTLNRSGTTVGDVTDGSKSVQAGVESINNASMVPAFPTSKSAHQNTRPTISNPILEASTCTAKELISPLRHSSGLANIQKVPLRAAPSVPSNKRPLSSPNSVVNSIVKTDEEPSVKKPKEGLTLNRIASFLKQEKNDKDKSRNPVKRSNSLPKNPNHIVKKNIDKNALKNLQISNPILMSDIELPTVTVPVISDSEDNDDGSKMMNRAQSMRGPTSPPKTNIATFGSMRQPSGTKRPTSIPVSNRPTSPPPPRPDIAIEKKPVKPTNSFFPNQKLPSLPGYQNPSNIENRINSFNKLNEQDSKPPEYDDCVAEKHAPLANISEELSSDNIYAVIEESPPPGSVNKSFGNSMPNSANRKIVSTPSDATTRKPVGGPISTSNESMGLLGEIVSEIENRNLDSIYSTSTLARKKADKEKKGRPVTSDKDSDFDDGTIYANTSQYESDNNEYSNLGGVKSISSAASTTSSGYLNPAVVNVPVNRLNPPSYSVNSNMSTNSVPPPFKMADSNDVNTNKENSFKPYVSTLNRPLGPFAASYSKDKNTNSTDVVQPKTSEASVIAKENNIPSLKQNTSVPKSTSLSTNVKDTVVQIQANSPDLVSSCATNLKSAKSPDVVNSNGNQTTASNVKVSGVNQGVILKPTLPTSNKPTTKVSNPFIPKPPLKQVVKPSNNTSDSSKPVRTAPSPPVNTNIERKKIPPPRPGLPKLTQQNSQTDKSNSNNSLSSSKSSSIEKNLSNISKANSDKHKPSTKTNLVKKNSDGVTKLPTASSKSNAFPKTNNITNLQQKFEPMKNGNRMTTTTK